MKVDKIKSHLKTYEIYAKRRTTINHAFASAIAPVADYDIEYIKGAMKFLKLDAENELLCVFCREEAETWDHLVGLVKNGELRGFGHQIGNLVPCCKKCNSEKGSKLHAEFISKSNRIKGNKAELKALLDDYSLKYANPVNLDNLKVSKEAEYNEYLEVKYEIFKLMQKADLLAKNLRGFTAN
jgi:hypothetical protein